MDTTVGHEQATGPPADDAIAAQNVAGHLGGTAAKLATLRAWKPSGW